MYNQIGFVGLGLIGGSLAKGIKGQHLAKSIVAYNRDQKVLEEAVSEGVVDIAATSIDHHFSQCDLIFLCCPVKVNVEAYRSLIHIVKPGCVITDVGSTKQDIMDAVAQIGSSVTFIGGHPMAGSEKTRYSAASPYLFENAYYILTPQADGSSQAVAKLSCLVSELKAIPIVIDAKSHDAITATISHAPHIIAASMVNIVKELDTPEGHMHLLAAGGFKDITRIASSSPVMWQQICTTNHEAIVKVLTYFKNDLEKIIADIESQSQPGLLNLFERAKNYRDSFQDRVSGTLQKAFAVAVDILDVPGMIAQIATLLSLHQISIKNIGIIHNREEEPGVLEIVFYDEQAMNESIDILQKMHYTVYPR